MAFAGKPSWRGRLSAVDLLIKICCLYSFSSKRNWCKLVCTKRSTVLIFQLWFHGLCLVLYLMESRWSKLVRTRRSTVLILQLGFPGLCLVFYSIERSRFKLVRTRRSTVLTLQLGFPGLCLVFYSIESICPKYVSLGLAPALLANIRLDWKDLLGANTLDYKAIRELWIKKCCEYGPKRLVSLP
jgi:hypothetical protein